MLRSTATDSTDARYHPNPRRWSALAQLVAVCGMLATGGACAQSSSLMPAFKAGEWNGFVGKSADGSVEGCQATNRKPDQFPRPYVYMDTDGEIALAVVDMRWGPWPEGSTVPVRLVIDDRTIASYDAEALDPRGLAIDLQRNVLLSSVKPDSRVSIETKRGTATVAVDGLSELLNALDKCVASKPPDSQAATDTTTATVLTCRFGNENADREALSCNNLTGFSLECRSGTPRDTSSTLTVSFDERTQRILGRGAVKSAKFTETEISWTEPLGEGSWRVFEIERFSGAITMYGPAVKFDGGKEKRIAGQMTRLATGSCQVAKDRLF